MPLRIDAPPQSAPIWLARASVLAQGQTLKSGAALATASMPMLPPTPAQHPLGTRRLLICDTGLSSSPGGLAIVFLCIIDKIMIKDDQGGFMMMFFSHSVVDSAKAPVITS